MSALLERPVLIENVFITGELLSRKPSKTDFKQEKLALQDLAIQMVDHPGDVLPHLVDLAIEICGSVSGGISLFEELPTPGVFRWHHLRGDLERFTGATTPRNFSPCGVTLDEANPVLVRRPERMYGWLAEHGVSLPECLLVPLYVGGSVPQGTLWIVSESEEHFDSGHARVMTELAAFAGIALRMLGTENRLSKALAQQETLTNEMGHRIKNLLTITCGMIHVSVRGASTPNEMADLVVGRLEALAVANDLVRHSFGLDAADLPHVNLADLIQTILRPHEGGLKPTDKGRIIIDGPRIMLGDNAANGFALLFHELSTNAAKYGALLDKGTVSVSWREADGRLLINWLERGGPVIQTAPTRSGFGTRLTKNTIESRLDGTLTYDWKPEGLSVVMCVPIEKLNAAQ
jgi:two-component sensor histidine kinase